MDILALQDVNTYYGDSHVIQGLSLHVGCNEAVSILGRNGVGKTTTLRTIMGLTPPRSGEIRVAGKDVTGLPPHRIAMQGVAYIPTERHIFPGLTVLENLQLAGRSSPAWDGMTIGRVFEYFPVLKKKKNQDGSTMSGGEQQMLAIGRALMSNPRIMLLDEPCQGLAPLMVDMFVEIVKSLCRERELALLLVEQNFSVAMKLAGRHYLMDTRGRIKRVLTAGDPVQDKEVIKQHLAI